MFKTGGKRVCIKQFRGECRGGVLTVLIFCRFLLEFPLFGGYVMVKKAPKTSDLRSQGDKKLSGAELETYRKLLVALRTRIRGDVSTMADSALSQSRSEAAGDLSAMPLHMADIGSDNFEREQTLSFIQSDSNTLLLIDDALARIRDGTYGICENCGCSIPKVRLDVLPYTDSCVRCVELAQENK